VKSRSQERGEDDGEVDKQNDRRGLQSRSKASRG